MVKHGETRSPGHTFCQFQELLGRRFNVLRGSGRHVAHVARVDRCDNRRALTLRFRSMVGDSIDS